MDEQFSADSLKSNLRTKRSNSITSKYFDAKSNLSQNCSLGLYFEDGVRKIDYVLVYKQPLFISDDHDVKREQKRIIYERNLEKEGLQIEKTNPKENSSRYVFVKIHAPFPILCKYAQMMNIKMPIKEDSFEVNNSTNAISNFCNKHFRNPFKLPPEYKPRERQFFTCPFNQDYITRFLIRDESTFFDNAKRSRIVYEILSRAKYDVQALKFGLCKLLATQTYLTAYPLHDGPSYYHHYYSTKNNNFNKNNINDQWQTKSTDTAYKIENKTKLQHSKEKEQTFSMLSQDACNDKMSKNGVGDPCFNTPPPLESDRQILYRIWARGGVFYMEQPIALIRKYFGEKIAIYFAWLGFYTAMLIPAAFFGILCFVYGIATFHTYVPILELCDVNGVGNITMCPLCDELCDFWKLSDSCLYTKLTYLFDNRATVAFSIFMSFWSTLFLELWKRRQNTLAWAWDTKDFEEEEMIRPEYEHIVKTVRRNPVTGQFEPYLPLISRTLRVMGAGIAVLTFLIMVLGVVFGVIIYRLSIVSVLHGQRDRIISQNAKITTNISSAILNLIAIIILNRIYAKIATYLTNLECPRTRTDYEDSYTLKMFLFQFVNFYSSLIYIAFFKGRFSGTPAGGGKVFGYRLEPCEPAGCMAELFIQFVVIMIGKQALNNIQELLFPVIMNWWRRRKTLSHRLQKRVRNSIAQIQTFNAKSFKAAKNQFNTENNHNNHEIYQNTLHKTNVGDNFRERENSNSNSLAAEEIKSSQSPQSHINNNNIDNNQTLITVVPNNPFEHFNISEQKNIVAPITGLSYNLYSPDVNNDIIATEVQSLDNIAISSAISECPENNNATKISSPIIKASIIQHGDHRNKFNTHNKQCKNKVLGKDSNSNAKPKNKNVINKDMGLKQNQDNSKNNRTETATICQNDSNSTMLPRYEEDFDLEDTGEMGLFYEYLEMGIQFGFTTMFVAAFPLAPLFSLLNNVIEIRLDAYKYVTQFRRQVATRVQDIGVWYEIINVIAKLAVITNAMIIAFTSDFIPKLVYKYHFVPKYTKMSTSTVQPNQFINVDYNVRPVPQNYYQNYYFDTTSINNKITDMAAINSYESVIPFQRYGFGSDMAYRNRLGGYLNFSLSTFNLSQLAWPLRFGNGTYQGSYVRANFERISVCRYRDFREPDPPYEYSHLFWVILVARLAFVLIFEHVVFTLTEAIAYLIPDMPYVLKVHLARQRLLLRGALYNSKSPLLENNDSAITDNTQIESSSNNIILSKI